MAEDIHSILADFEARLWAGLDARFKAQEAFIHERYRKTDAKLDLVLAELSDLKPRATAVEVQLGYLTAAVGRTNERIDRVDVRLGRIEKRLDKLEETVKIGFQLLHEDIFNSRSETRGVSNRLVVVETTVREMEGCQRSMDAKLDLILKHLGLTP